MPTEKPNNPIEQSDLSDTQLADTVFVADGSADETASKSTTESAKSGDDRFSNNSMAHFKIVDILGKGGMGAVYKAKDLALERYVAIKVLRIEHAHLPIILAEAKTISQLNHPNIVTVYDIARDDDENFIVMEWINGQPLNAIIPSNGLPLTKVVEYAKQMVAALDCAHQQGIIHRDIKPHNIMLDGNGQIKMLDFGIATLQGRKLFQDQNQDQDQCENQNQVPSHAQNTSGSPQYRSPEQTLGQACDARSDLFSLGIVLYEMLTGVKPFLGLNAHHIGLAITRGDYTPIQTVLVEQQQNSKARKEVRLNHKQQRAQAELIAIIERLLTVEPSARFADAKTLLAQLTTLDQHINQSQNWWQQQHWLTKTLLVIPIFCLLGWSVHSVVFPPSTQELIERQLIGSKKIAFVPFDNISGDPVLQIFSDGIATMLSSDLAEVGYQQGDGSTWVLPSSEIRQMDDPSISGIYNKYGVDVVVTGSIQHMGSTRSIQLSLVNAKDGRVLKSSPLSVDAEQLFDAQKHIRQQVMALLGWQIPPALAKQFSAQKPQLDGAYKYYLQGQGYLYRFDHADNIDNAINAFETAIELDPNYGDAYAGLAQAQLRQFIETKETSLLTSVKQTLKRLQQLKPAHRLVNYLQGELALKQGQYQQAVQHFKEVVETTPNFAKAYTSMSLAYFELGNVIEAEKTLKTAYELLPNNYSVLIELGIFYYSQGSYHQAVRYFELLAAQAPNNYIAYLNISACYYLSGDIEQAIAAVRKSLAIKPEADGYANLGTMYFILNEYNNAVHAYEQMIALNDSDYINWGNLADAYRFANNEKFQNAFSQAISLAEQALTVNPHNKNAIASLAYYYANVDNSEKTNLYSQKITNNGNGAEQFLIAAAYARLGETEAAIRYLTLAIDNEYSVAEIARSPLFQSLKNEPAFNQLINKD